MVKSFLAIAICFMFTSMALADPPDNRPPNNRPPSPSQKQLGINAQAQGQIQGQKQQQQQRQRSSSKSGVEIGHNSMNPVSKSTSSASNGDQAQTQGNAQTINFNGPEKTSVHSSGEVDINTTPDVSAPALTAGMNPCAMSSSAGAAITGFGVSVGSSWTDEGCELRNLAGMLSQMGYADASRELLCQDERVAAAFSTVGTPCKGPVAVPQTADYQQVIPNGPLLQNVSVINASYQLPEGR